MTTTQTPDAEHFLQFWLIIAFLGMAIGQVISIFISISNRKQAREVSFTFTPASKEEFDQFTASTNGNFVQIREEMKQDRHENQIHASARQAKLFDEIKSIRTELDRKLEDNRRELADKIDNMSDRVIATLKNTNAI
jgi:DNA anti-recombination protein RmuC